MLKSFELILISKEKSIPKILLRSKSIVIRYVIKF